MSKPTPTSDGASAAARGSSGLEKRVLPPTSGLRRAEVRQRRALPHARGVIAQAVVGREPAAIHARAAHARAIRIVDGGITHGEALAVGETGHHGFEGGEVRRRLAIGAGDHRAARHAGRAEDVAGIGHVHAVHGDVEMPRHLVRHGVHHGVAELEVGRGRDGVQVAHVELGVDRLAAALELAGPPCRRPCRRSPARAARTPRPACRSRAPGRRRAAACRRPGRPAALR